MNLTGAITIKLYDGSHNLLATKTAKLAHIKELTATQKQFSSAFIVQSGTYPTGGVSSSWEVGAMLPAIDTKPVTAEIEMVGTGTDSDKVSTTPMSEATATWASLLEPVLTLFYTVDGGNSWEHAWFAGSVDRTFS